MDGVKPLATPDDCIEAEEICKTDAKARHFGDQSKFPELSREIYVLDTLLSLMLLRVVISSLTSVRAAHCPCGMNAFRTRRKACLNRPAPPAQVVAMLKERGLEDVSLVVCDPWSVHLAPDDLASCKLIQLFMYFRTEPNDNHYAHPLDFTPIVDLYQKKACARFHATC